MGESQQARRPAWISKTMMAGLFIYSPTRADVLLHCVRLTDISHITGLRVRQMHFACSTCQRIVTDVRAHYRAWCQEYGEPQC